MCHALTATRAPAPQLIEKGGLQGVEEYDIVDVAFRSVDARTMRAFAWEIGYSNY